MAVYVRINDKIFNKYKHKSPCSSEEHFHNKHELYYLIEGYTKYFIGDELYILNPGDMIFIPKGMFHKTSTNAERMLLMFTEDDLIEGYEKYIDELSSNKYITFSSKYQGKIRDIMNKIDNENIKEEKDYVDMQKLCLHELLIFISRYRNDKSAVKFNHSYEFIQNVAKYIAENYSKDLSLEELSKTFSITPNHLSKQFKKVTDVCLNDYINITRITQAEKLLVNTDMSITEIASQCGFNDSSYFAAVFKKFKAITPKKYALMYNKKTGL